MYKSPVVLYWGNNADQNKLNSMFEQLHELGLSITACSSLTYLRKQIATTHKVDKAALVLVLDTQAPQAHAAITLAKALCSHAGILSILDVQNELKIIDYIQAGSDLYCDHSASASLQAALIWHLIKRIPTVSVGSNKQNKLPTGRTIQEQPQELPVSTPVVPIHNDPWVFLSNGWTLMSPCKKQIKLTTVERRFFLKLLESEGYQATHKELLNAISFSEVQEPTRKQLMNLSVVVSRIKRKGTKEGVSIPLESVHGTGYMFAPSHMGVVSGLNP